MLLCTVILLGSVHPVLLLKMKDRDLMEGTLQKFVEDFMVPNLEDETNEVKYQCLLHERDFMPGRPIIDQITRAVDTSSCTMIVLSPNFVKSQWARQE